MYKYTFSNYWIKKSKTKYDFGYNPTYEQFIAKYGYKIKHVARYLYKYKGQYEYYSLVQCILGLLL